MVLGSEQERYDQSAQGNMCLSQSQMALSNFPHDMNQNDMSLCLSN